jgi:hypothetical protein
MKTFEKANMSLKGKTAVVTGGARGLVLKFENGVWPMPQSTPAPRGISYN